MASHANMYIAFFENGTKEGFEASSDEQYTAQLAELKERTGSDIEFVTNAADNYPFDYDWDSKLGLWQSKIF